MTILNAEEIQKIVDVQDYILRNSQKSVAHIREQFGLTVDEYNMIFDLCMPKIRNDSAVNRWKFIFFSLRDKMNVALDLLKEGEIETAMRYVDKHLEKYRCLETPKDIEKNLEKTA